MIRWKIAELLEKRGWKAYRLAQEAKLTVPAAYRLAKGDAVRRIDTATLERLCDVFNVEPAALIERVTVSTKRSTRRRS